MAESTELRDEGLAQTRSAGGETATESFRVKLRRALQRAVYWSSERGSWQYDLIVLAILCFIFASPRAWFDDRPTLQLTDLRHQQGFVELGRNKEGTRYLIDARLVDMVQAEKPEIAIQQILQQRLAKPFKVKSIDIIRDRNKVTLGYNVVVAP